MYHLFVHWYIDLFCFYRWNIDNSKQHDSCGGQHLYQSWKKTINVVAGLPLGIKICEQIQALMSERNIRMENNQAGLKRPLETQASTSKKRINKGNAYSFYS